MARLFLLERRMEKKKKERNENGDVEEFFFPLHGLPLLPWMESWEEHLAPIKVLRQPPGNN